MLKKAILLLILFSNETFIVFSQSNSTKKLIYVQKMDSLKFTFDGGSSAPWKEEYEVTKFFLPYAYIENYLNKYASSDLKAKYFKSGEVVRLFFYVNVDNEVTHIEIEKTSFEELKLLIMDALKAMSTEEEFLKSNSNFMTMQNFTIHIHKYPFKN